MKIKIQHFEIQNIDYRNLKPIQGELKDFPENNFKKLKKSFSQKGMFVPVFVWNDRGEYKILDGHGREKLFKSENAQFINEKGEQTFEIPCLVIGADSMQDAKEKLLIISSSYQNIDQEGLEDFISDLDEKWVDEITTFESSLKESQDKVFLDKEDSTQFLIVIDCKTEENQRVLYERLEREGHECKLIM